MKPLLFLACILAGLACGSVASASQFVNGSFEDPATYFKVLYTGESIPGWTVLGGTIDLNGYGLWQPSNGEMSVDMVGTPARGAIAQTLQFDTAGPHYLTFDLSRNPNINYITASMGVWWKAPGSDEFAGLGLFAFDKLNQPADMMWQQMGTATFTAGPGPVTFVFEALSGGDGNDTASWGGAALDNVQLVAGASPYSPQLPPPFVLPDPLQGHYTVYDDVGPAGVPEPGTLILLLLSAPLFLVARSRSLGV